MIMATAGAAISAPIACRRPRRVRRRRCGGRARRATGGVTVAPVAPCVAPPAGSWLVMAFLLRRAGAYCAWSIRDCAACCPEACASLMFPVKTAWLIILIQGPLLSLKMAFSTTLYGVLPLAIMSPRIL